MKEIMLNGYLLEMYDSIEELPERRFQLFNRYAVIDAGLGSDLDAVSRHISLLLQYNEHGRKEDVAQLANNLLQSLAFVVQGINPKMYCFAVMVRAVNGRPWEDTSTAGAERLAQMLSEKGLTAGKVRGFLEYAKKKLTKNLRSFFRALPGLRRRQRNTTGP